MIFLDSILVSIAKNAYSVHSGRDRHVNIRNDPASGREDTSECDSTIDNICLLFGFRLACRSSDFAGDANIKCHFSAGVSNDR